ncbi:MAG: hypothetical protein ACYCXQ_00835 [Candidatus Humimicrobiaceae bacterium]
MNGEVMTQDEDMPVVLGADNLVQMADMAEKRVNAIKKIKQAALSVTSKHDWVDQGGKPYLQVSGSEKVARLFGISWRIDEPQLTTEEDGHYSYTYKGYFTLGPTTIEAIGSRGSKDLFFSRAHQKDIPVSEIDRNDIKKAAYTNLLGNGITRMLGLRGLTWEEVGGAGIKKEDTGKVDYTKKEMSEDKKDLKAEMDKMLDEMTKGDKETIGNLIYKYTSFTAADGKEVSGKTTLIGLTEKSIPVVYGKIKKAYDEWKAQNEPA